MKLCINEDLKSIAENFLKDVLKYGEIELADMSEEELICEFLDSKIQKDCWYEYVIELLDKYEDAYNLLEGYYESIQLLIKKHTETELKSYITFENDFNGAYYIYAIQANQQDIKASCHYLTWEDMESKITDSVCVAIDKEAFEELEISNLISYMNTNLSSVEEQVIFDLDDVDDELIFNDNKENMLVYEEFSRTVDKKIEQLIEKCANGDIAPVRQYDYCCALQNYLMEFDLLEESLEEEDLFDENVYPLYSKVESEILNRLHRHLEQNGIEYTEEFLDDLCVDDIVEYIEQIL